jgi:hypothetical protein
MKRRLLVVGQMERIRVNLASMSAGRAATAHFNRAAKQARTTQHLQFTSFYVVAFLQSACLFLEVIASIDIFHSPKVLAATQTHDILAPSCRTETHSNLRGGEIEGDYADRIARLSHLVVRRTGTTQSES